MVGRVGVGMEYNRCQRFKVVAGINLVRQKSCVRFVLSLAYSIAVNCGVVAPLQKSGIYAVGSSPPSRPGLEWFLFTRSAHIFCQLRL